MIKLKTIDEATNKISPGQLPEDVVLDILTQLTIMETEFKDYQPNLNEVVILDNFEEYDEPDLVPEIDENIGNYNKKLFILSDSGEGIFVYRKLTGEEND